MTRYERRVLSCSDDVYDVEGRIVEVLDAPRAGRNTITALVEPAPGGDTAGAVPADSEGVDDETVYCVGTKGDGGRCSREVDEPGDRCFQHPEDDE